MQKSKKLAIIVGITSIVGVTCYLLQFSSLDKIFRSSHAHLHLLRTKILKQRNGVLKFLGRKAEMNRTRWRQNILCFLPVNPIPKATKAASSVKKTWGKRCDTLLLFSTVQDDKLGTIKVPFAREGYPFLWLKVLGGLKYIYENHIKQADWILKADVDTFIIMEHLREFLSDFSPQETHFFGSLANTPYAKGKLHVCGGAGYILSKESVKRLFRSNVLSNYSTCGSPWFYTQNGKKHSKYHGEDVEMTTCMVKLNISPTDTLDERGRGRLLQFPLINHLTGFPKVYRKQYEAVSHHVLPPGKGSLSDTLIGLHRVNPNEMHMLDFLLYDVKPVQPLAAALKMIMMNETKKLIST